jgi:hypothetical protein
MASKELPPQSALYGLITGYHLSYAIHVAAKLGLADLLADGPRHYTELATATGTHAPSLNRLLRLLVNAAVFTEDDQKRFGLTPIGACLRADAPDSMRAPALFWGESRLQLVWSRLLRCVQTGKPAFPQTFGTDAFSYLSQHGEDADMFDQGMAAWTQQTACAVSAAYDFSQFGVVVDVGGGSGTLLASLLTAHENLRGVLFDLPHFTALGENRLAQLGLASRCKIASGSFFEEVPAGGDAYVLSNVIWDWDDDRARVILRNCHAAMAANSKLLVIEAVYPARIDRSPASRAAVSTDVNLMVCTGGCQRSEEEFRALFDSVGFKLTRIVPTSTRPSVIEGLRA